MYADSLVNFSLIKGPRSNALASPNADLFQILFAHLDSHTHLTLRMFWVASHLDDTPILIGFIYKSINAIGFVIKVHSFRILPDYRYCRLFCFPNYFVWLYSLSSNGESGALLRRQLVLLWLVVVIFPSCALDLDIDPRRDNRTAALELELLHDELGMSQVCLKLVTLRGREEAGEAGESKKAGAGGKGSGGAKDGGGRGQ